MYAYVFSMLAGIIPLSLRNGGGAFDTVCPPSLRVGATALSTSRLRCMCLAVSSRKVDCPRSTSIILQVQAWM